MQATCDISEGVFLIPPNALFETEAVCEHQVCNLVNKIAFEAIWTHPLCVEKETRVVMDGHHRLKAAKALDLAYVPVVAFDYEQVRLYARRGDYAVSPAEVIRRGLEGKTYPCKTTRHVFSMSPVCRLSLENLRGSHNELTTSIARRKSVRS